MTTEDALDRLFGVDPDEIVRRQLIQGGWMTDEIDLIMKSISAVISDTSRGWRWDLAALQLRNSARIIPKGDDWSADQMCAWIKEDWTAERSQYVSALTVTQAAMTGLYAPVLLRDRPPYQPMSPDELKAEQARLAALYPTTPETQAELYQQLLRSLSEDTERELQNEGRKPKYAEEENIPDIGDLGPRPS